VAVPALEQISAALYLQQTYSQLGDLLAESILLMTVKSVGCLFLLQFLGSLLEFGLLV